MAAGEKKLNYSAEEIDNLLASIPGKESKINKVISLNELSTDEQYPSAKIVYTLINALQTAFNNLDAIKMISVNSLESGDINNYTSPNIYLVQENFTDSIHGSSKRYWVMLVEPQLYEGLYNENIITQYFFSWNKVKYRTGNKINSDSWNWDVIQESTYAIKGDIISADIVDKDTEPTENSNHVVTSGGIFNWVTNLLAPFAADDEPTEGSENMVKSGGVFSWVNSLLSDALQTDNEPTENSTKFVKSGGIFSWVKKLFTPDASSNNTVVLKTTNSSDSTQYSQVKVGANGESIELEQKNSNNESIYIKLNNNAGLNNTRIIINLTDENGNSVLELGSTEINKLNTLLAGE